MFPYNVECARPSCLKGPVIHFIDRMADNKRHGLNQLKDGSEHVPFKVLCCVRVDACKNLYNAILCLMSTD